MAKIKLTKSELKRQRDSLKQFKRYLPTLQLKKQQLQTKILEVRKLLDQVLEDVKDSENRIREWSGLLADEVGVNLQDYMIPTDVRTSFINIAGANVPIFEDITFKDPDYDLYATPFWVDAGIEKLQEYVTFMVKAAVLQKQIAILERELRTTTQRVNLFEKVKIPECQNNIRMIRIYLGDQQANAVGVSKVAKKKVEIRNLEPAAV